MCGMCLVVCVCRLFILNCEIGVLQKCRLVSCAFNLDCLFEFADFCNF